MKELSIEEKAKRYDEAIERAKKVLLDCTSEEQKVVEYISPELKESEDARIRKELIKAFKEFLKQNYYHKDTNFKGVNIKEAIAWLEKQGKQNVPSREIVLNVWELGNIWQEITKGVCNTEHGTQLEYIIKHWNEGEHYTEWLEKQGEKKAKYHDVCDKCIRQSTCQSDCFLQQGEQKPNPVLDIEIPFGARDSELLEETISIPEGCYATIDGNRVVIKRGERKPADKVEPKFKVGDWIVSNDKYVHDDYRVCKITKIVDGRYYIEGGDFLSESSLALYEYRLWTIQDAKEGDVILDGNNPFIFKKIKYNSTHCYAFCGIGQDGNFMVNPYNWYEKEDPSEVWTWGRNLKPATKEQRDLLFQKMKEAGYEWDAEKKELKKIEQKPNPVLDIEIPFGARDSELLEETISIPKGCYATIDGNRVGY